MKESDKKELLDLVTIRNERMKYNLLETRFPDFGPYSRDKYQKHLDFFKAGASFFERAFVAGNGTWKTNTGLTEAVYHATGLYPTWWEGRRFKKGVTIWICGSTIEIIRDSIQVFLLGNSAEIGTGLIPKAILDKGKTMAASGGVSGAVGKIIIPHATSGFSTITFKTYNAGQSSVEAASVDVAMIDEECPMAFYTEICQRVIRTRGIVYSTFTPDEGLTETTLQFFDGGNFTAGARNGKYVVMCAVYDVPHITEEDIARMIATIPPYLRDAKLRGIPYVGSGAVYPVVWDEVEITPFKIPDWYPRAYGMDLGWTDPTTVIWGAWDRDTDTIYIYDEYSMSRQDPSYHATAIKKKCQWKIPGVADPKTIAEANKADGQVFMDMYTKEGLDLDLADNTKEAGIQEVLMRMNSGRLRIFSSVVDLLCEARLYRRNEKGIIPKNTTMKDDRCDAMRYLVMSGGARAKTRYEAEFSLQKSLFNKNRNDSRDSVSGY